MTSATAPNRLSTFWNQRSFSIDDVDFLWIDVTLAAMAHGEWAGFERQLAEGLACAARAEAERMYPDESAIEDAATAFRYDRDLISGAEMSAWLDAAGLDNEDWMACLTRHVLRQLWAADLEDVLDEFPPSARQLEEAALGEGVCWGCFEAFARSFSERAALAFEQDGTVFEDQPVPPALADAATRLARQHAHWLARRPEAETIARLAAILRISEAYETACRRLVCDDALHGVVEAHRLEWLRVDLESVSFSTEDAAREAVLCVKADGLTLRDVGSLSRRPVERSQVFLADVCAARRDSLLSADAGAVLGPWPHGDRFEVAVVAGRFAPTLDDEVVIDRARHALVDQAAGRAARERVRRPV